MKRRNGERGAALIVVLFASALILLLLLTALTVTRTSGVIMARQLSSQGQATSAASAGLTETLSWFVRQRQQPVLNFNPQVDVGACTHIPAHVPPAFDSEDPAVGITRSFEISNVGRVWGRYEVRRPVVRDVSLRRGKPQPGTVWQIESEGMVYVRNDPDLAPDVNPNWVLARRTMRVDIQRLGLQLPAPAAVSSVAGNNINVIRPSRIQGGAAGIGAAYPAQTGTPGVASQITGSPSQSVTGNPFTIEFIFGVTVNELMAMADLVVDDERDLPNPIPDMSLVVVRGNATFNSTRTLQGSGILVVLGNLILNPRSNAFYSGVIWVGGTFVMTPPGTISGALVTNGTVQLAGGSDVAEINYDPAIIDQIRQQMGNYLYSRSPWIVGAGD